MENALLSHGNIYKQYTDYLINIYRDIHATNTDLTYGNYKAAMLQAKTFINHFVSLDNRRIAKINKLYELVISWLLL